EMKFHSDSLTNTIFFTGTCHQYNWNMSSHIIKDLPYKARLDHAVEWSLANPKESFLTSARIHHVSEKSIQSRVLRARKGPGPGAGGQNRVLTAEQAAAIVQYCREAAEYSCGATRDMV